MPSCFPPMIALFLLYDFKVYGVKFVRYLNRACSAVCEFIFDCLHRKPSAYKRGGGQTATFFTKLFLVFINYLHCLSVPRFSVFENRLKRTNFAIKNARQPRTKSRSDGRKNILKKPDKLLN